MIEKCCQFTCYYTFRPLGVLASEQSQVYKNISTSSCISKTPIQCIETCIHMVYTQNNLHIWLINEAPDLHTYLCKLQSQAQIGLLLLTFIRLNSNCTHLFLTVKERGMPQGVHLYMFVYQTLITLAYPPL